MQGIGSSSWEMACSGGQSVVGVGERKGDAKLKLGNQDSSAGQGGAGLQTGGEEKGKSISTPPPMREVSKTPNNSRCWQYDEDGKPGTKDSWLALLTKLGIYTSKCRQAEYHENPGKVQVWPRLGGSVTWYEKRGKIILGGKDSAMRHLLNLLTPVTEEREDVPERECQLLPRPNAKGELPQGGSK